MAKSEIKKLVEDSKKEIDHDTGNFAKAIKDELSSFKKKTLDQI